MNILRQQIATVSTHLLGLHFFAFFRINTILYKESLLIYMSIYYVLQIYIFSRNRIIKNFPIFNLTQYIYYTYYILYILCFYIMYFMYFIYFILIYIIIFLFNYMSFMLQVLQIASRYVTYVSIMPRIWFRYFIT